MTSKAGGGAEVRKHYWRSIDRLLDSPAVREQLAASPEFPEGADLPPGTITRRGMMTLMGASFALAGLTGCRRPVEHIVPYVDAPEGIIPGIPRHYATTLEVGGAAYGALVESHEGRPGKVEGNALHPASLGAASAWMQAALLDLYDPDRSRRHLKRAKGKPFEPLSWPAMAKELITLRKEAIEEQGEGWAVLATGSASPTVARLLGLLGFVLPKARVVTWEPLSDHHILRGLTLATGDAYLPNYHLDRAQVVLSLDADLLHTETDHLRNARGFARARAVGDGDPLRLYAVESTLSVTGANADHRLRVKRAEVGAVLAAVAAELVAAGMDLPLEVPPAPLSAEVRERTRLIARDLLRAGSTALVAAGRAQPPAVHALAFAVNRALGAFGTTVTLASAEGRGVSDPERLADLAAAMHSGEINTLFVLGGNPAYDAPADLDFAGALRAVETIVHLATERNETTEHATHHVSQTSSFEEWGDERAPDGTLSVVQPLIAPLFDGRSAIELLVILGFVGERAGYEAVRDTWYDLVEEDDFEAVWRRVLHDGVYVPGPEPAADEEPSLAAAFTSLAAGAAADDAHVRGGAPGPGPGVPSPPALDVAAVTAALAELGAPAPGLELTFDASRSLWDGRYANNAWLQELPDPITKIVWDNAALISPATAARLALESGDIARIAVGDEAIETPVWVLPGQADDSIALELGYGRSHSGRVGSGVGVDAYPLRTRGGLWQASAELEATGARYHLVQTQEHWSLEGRPLYRETDVEGFHEDPRFAADEHAPVYEQPFPSVDYGDGHQWAMAIDLGACIGCNACVVACQAENNIPVVGREQVDKGREMHWLRVDRYFVGELDDPSVAMQPIPCMHCENAPCEQVCPVAATVHDSEGLNAMVYNRCIGTRYCSNNCPYKVRRFNFFNYTKDTPELLKLAMNPDVTVRSRGVMEKCSYCVQRINETKIEAKRAERSVAVNEIKTACQQTCPTEAIVFGDLNQPESEVVARKHNVRNYVLIGELNNRPRTSYLGRVRNPNPAWTQGEGA